MYKTRSQKQLNENKKIIFHIVGVSPENEATVVQLHYDPTAIASNLDINHLKDYYPDINKIVTLPQSEYQRGKSNNLSSVLAVLYKDVLINTENNHHKYLHVFASGRLHNADLIYPVGSLGKKLIAISDYLEHYRIDLKQTLLLLPHEHKNEYDLALSDLELTLPPMHFVSTIDEAIDILNIFHTDDSEYTKTPHMAPLSRKKKILNKKNHITHKIILKHKNRSYKIKKNYYEYNVNLNYYTDIIEKFVEDNLDDLEEFITYTKNNTSLICKLIASFIKNNFQKYKFDKKFLTAMKEKYQQAAYVLENMQDDSDPYVQIINSSVLLHTKPNHKDILDNITDTTRKYALEKYLGIDCSQE
jgi:hypothetical protein